MPSVITEKNASVMPNASASGRRDAARAGSAGCAVRASARRCRASYHMLSAPDAPAPTAMQSSAVNAEHRMQMARRDHEADQRGEDHQRHHPRLQQRDVVARPPASADPGRTARWRRDRRSTRLGLASRQSTARAATAVRRRDRASLHARQPSNWWNGGGEDSVHSSVVAPAPHGLSPACSLRDEGVDHAVR